MSWDVLFRIRQYLKGSLWFFPLIGAILSPLAGVIVHQADGAARGNSPGSPKQVRLTRPDVQAAVTVVGCPHVVGAMGVLVCRRRRDTERDIRPIDLTGADLTAADLTAADLTAANLARANLTRTNLIGAVLTRAYLGDAKLISTMLQGADLTHANLVGADLTGASLVRTDLTGADLTRANLTDVRWPEGVPVPEGWLVDDKSSGLKLADELSEVIAH